MLADLPVAGSPALLNTLARTLPDIYQTQQAYLSSCKGLSDLQVIGSHKQYLQQRSRQRPMTPAFCFTVKEMRPAANVRETYDNQGVWHPPQTHGHNVTVGRTRAFACDGTTIEPIPLSEVPPADPSTCYGTTSAYVYQDAFHIVNYDASVYAIGGGYEAPSSRSAPASRTTTPEPMPSTLQRRHSSQVQTLTIQEEQPESTNSQSLPTPSPSLPYWARLRFHHLPAQHGYRSFASPDGSQIRLQTQRPDQAWWARRLLPEAYWAPNRSWTHVQNRGGLVGELPLLLALVAFSVPSVSLEAVFTDCFEDGQWDFSCMRDMPHGRECLQFGYSQLST